MIAAYLIGVPGSGKSTLMRALTDHLDVSWYPRPFAHAVYWSDEDRIGAQIGGHHPTFPGTDRLSMAVQPRAIEWVQSQPHPVIVGEGDRLATAGFLDALTRCSRFDLVWLDTPEHVAALRRADRGSNQKPSWLAGRATKIRRLVEARPHVRLDGTLGMPDLLDAAGEVPAFGALLRAHRGP